MTDDERSLEEQLELAHAVRADLDTALAEGTWCHVVVPRMHLNWARMFNDADVVARRLRGRVMHTHDGFENEITAALAFPDDFEDARGELNGWLADLDWLPTTAGYLLLITDPDQLLSDEPPAGPATSGRRLEDVVTSFTEAAAAFAEPIQDGGDDDRPALSFDVVLLPSSDHEADVRRRWRDAGAPLDA